MKLVSDPYKFEYLKLDEHLVVLNSKVLMQAIESHSFGELLPPIIIKNIYIPSIIIE